MCTHQERGSLGNGNPVILVIEADYDVILRISANMSDS